jgi:hypothetical protein
MITYQVSGTQLTYSSARNGGDYTVPTWQFTDVSREMLDVSTEVIFRAVEFLLPNTLSWDKDNEILTRKAALIVFTWLRNQEGRF